MTLNLSSFLLLCLAYFPVGRCFGQVVLGLPPPGHSMPKGTKQGDDQRRRLLDNHQHRQGRIHLLRGHGPRPLACHPGACGGELTGIQKRQFRFFFKFPPLTGHFTCTTSQVCLSCLSAAKRRRGCRHAGADGTELHSKSAGLVRRR